jgi:5-methylcytosine-specific restriction endonuclease McrA
VKPAIATAVLARADGRCEKCGEPCLRPVLHHRKRRAQGGLDDVANLLAVAPSCHNMSRGSIHDHPAMAKHYGYIVSAGHLPSETPMLLHGARWVLLRDDGTYLDVPIRVEAS